MRFDYYAKQWDRTSVTINHNLNNRVELPDFIGFVTFLRFICDCICDVPITDKLDKLLIQLFWGSITQTMQIRLLQFFIRL